MVARRGENVVLECRDADDNWVYWRKRGGEGIQSLYIMRKIFHGNNHLAVFYPPTPQSPRIRDTFIEPQVRPEPISDLTNPT